MAGGARVGAGHVRAPLSEDQGNFFEPLVLEDMKESNPMYSEEFFGPVFLLYRVESEAEAIALANDSPYGLAGSVVSKDIERARKVAA